MTDNKKCAHPSGLCRRPFYAHLVSIGVDVCNMHYQRVTKKGYLGGPEPEIKKYGSGTCAQCSSYFEGSTPTQRRCSFCLGNPFCIRCGHDLSRNKKKSLVCTTCIRHGKRPNKECPQCKSVAPARGGSKRCLDCSLNPICVECGGYLKSNLGLKCPRCAGRVNEKPCANCGVLISGQGITGFCGPCSMKLHVSVVLAGRNINSDGFLNSDGYMCTPVPRDHSRYKVGKNKSAKIFVHRLKMENFLGRELLSIENVHHKNGVRDDNRIENLELWSSSQPSGQRVADKVQWAKELLALYEPTAITRKVREELRNAAKVEES